MRAEHGLSVVAERTAIAHAHACSASSGIA